MNIETLALPLLGGFCAGVLFFGGLWWTIRHGLQSAYPAVWFLASLILRMVLAISAFLLLSQGQWQRLAACLTGFLIARGVLLHRLSAADASLPSSGKERPTCG